MNKTKSLGQIYTPKHIVKEMLDISGYDSSIEILYCHIIDNSCGDGAFLVEVVRRYCTTFLMYYGVNNGLTLRKNLETYIHGIEIDDESYKQCLNNLDSIASSFNIHDVSWDIHNIDALKCDTLLFNNKMDFVVGNPPYVRTHNLGDNDLGSLSFINGGMPDLYIAFFEIGFNMLKNGGKLCYITPSSWLSSIAGRAMRNYILENKNILSLVDFEHFQVFDANTYVMISCFQKSTRHKNEFGYYVYDDKNGQKSKFITNLNYSDITIGDNFYLATKEELALLDNIRTKKSQKHVSVKNGIATLADKVFINNDMPFDEYTVPIIKASTGNVYKAFYPYDENGNPIPKSTIFSNNAISDYMHENSDKILKGRNIEDTPDWYLYGRSQAIKDVYKNKIAIGSCVKDINSIKFVNAPAGTAVYSGLYILTDIETDIVEFIIKSNEFINYIKTLKNYRSGGYYTFSSKDLELFLNYCLTFLI